MIATDLDQERARLLATARATHRTAMNVVSASPARGRFDLVVAVPVRPAARGREVYVNLYVADLSSPTCGWNPRAPLVYPSVTSLAPPFTHTFRDLSANGAFVGVLLSVCSATHEEVDWTCRIYRSRDGREVRDCRRAG
ncbi:MAG: hypothetical protein ACF8XB_24400 [Planctomycetota bacterium JB042]